MNTEITKQEDGSGTRGWIFFDAECAACVAGRNRTGDLFESRGFRWVPLQTPGAATRLGVNEAAFATRMHVLTADGRVRHNADAFGALCRSVWWLWPVGALLLVPGIREAGRMAYDTFARNRYCFGGRCRLPLLERGSVTRSSRECTLNAGTPTEVARKSRVLRVTNPRSGWLPLAVLPAITLCFQQRFEPWVFMWVLAFAIYLGCKWLTYCDALGQGVAASLRTRLVYLLCWPGMSLKEFAGPIPTSLRGNEGSHWLAPLAKTLAGAILVWLVVPVVPTDAWLFCGWIGMIGLIMMLHFGTFHLLALALQAAGFNARPNMRAPLLAGSLADFWGRRWNTAFNVLADRYGFRALTPRIGPRAALAVVFVASGLIHDLVIALPAGGGYGLPTLYFGLQAVGLFVERRPLIRRRPIANRLFAWLVLVAPLGWLFPPVFVRNVILPMLNALGAT